jgi:hypothetical protein
MSNDILHSKIELLEEQIENIERSGRFTEKEIDKLVAPLREELASLKKQIPLYGMTPESYNEGKRIHSLWFSNQPSPALKNTQSHFGMNLMSIQG